jgi:hypothetical protein
MELIGAEVRREMEKMKKKWERLGLIDFLEPDGSEYQRYIPYSRMDPLLACESNRCRNSPRSAREPNTPLIYMNNVVPANILYFKNENI